MDCVREETVSVSGRSGAQSSVESKSIELPLFGRVDQTVTVQRESVLGERGLTSRGLNAYIYVRW